MIPGANSAGGLAVVEVEGWGLGAGDATGLGVVAAETARLARRISLSWRVLPEGEAFLRMVGFLLTTAIFDPSTLDPGGDWPSGCSISK